MTRSVVFESQDQPLREDVSLLGRLIGEMLSDQLGTSFFALLEQVRRCAIARREDEPERLTDLTALLGDLPVERALDLVRAFSAYFQLVNLAEQVHRIRRRREHQANADAGPQPGGVMDALQRLRHAGVSPDAVREALGKLLLEPVFTAHPTEATRRTMLEKEQRIIRALVERLDSGRTPDEERSRLAQMRMHITAAWQTSEYSPVRPSVEQEREHVLFYLSDVLFRAVPACYAEFERCLNATYPELNSGAPLRPLLRFGTWVGGDMDGNPNVGADTIRDALAAHRRVLFARYQTELKDLSLILSQSNTRIAIDPAVELRVSDYSKRLRRAWASIPRRHRDMPYRCLLILMAARLAASLEDRDGAYLGPQEFIDDLNLIRLSLMRNGGRHAGLYPFQRFIARARTFGFHLAALDVRQHAEVHRASLAASVGGAPWKARSADDRRATLHAAIGGKFARPATPDDSTQRVLEVFDALEQSRARYGAAAVGVFIVSMSESADDVLAVLALARIAAGAGAELPLDVAPLFETVADLSAAPRILRELLADPVYREHLKQRGDRQVVMLGYSDSNKDGGIAASRYALQEAQATLSDIAHAAAIDLSFFHGRGGTASRGGGRTEKAVMSAPHGSVNGHLRLTEQGEVIHRKYAIRAIALRNIEQAFSGLLHATLNPLPPDPREGQWRQWMARIADSSRESYRDLVYGDLAFAEYFRAATPIDVIERMKIGSRPSLRKGDVFRIEHLRAIPWVFAWSQSRHGLPGWYGLGSGLQAICASEGEDQIIEMARDWPFFRLLLEDVEMVLAKSDTGIAAQYSALAGPLHARYWPLIEAEWRRTEHYILRIKGATQLLEYDRRLQRTIRLRNPYVDPISVLQVDMLSRWRRADRPDNALFEALVATVNGIARGLQNTG